MEKNNLNLNKSCVDLIDIARSVSSNFKMKMNKKNLTFLIDGDSIIVFADRNRISHVVTNLVSNAIKYTQENGNIKIMIMNSDKNGILVVEDNGISILENEVPLIFERFYRTDKSRNRKTGGAGIGLTIVKSIVLHTVGHNDRKPSGSWKPFYCYAAKKMRRN